MTRIACIALITSLFLMLSSCSSVRTVPTVPLDTTYDFSRIKMIGLCVIPSEKPEYDSILSNLINLHFTSLGYRVSYPIAVDPVQGTNQQDIILQLRNGAESEGENIDAFVVLSSRWFLVQQIFTIPGDSKHYTMDAEKVELDLSIVDFETGRTIVSGTAEDHTKFYEHPQNTMRFIADPPRQILQRIISKLVDDYPVCSHIMTYPVFYRIPVIYYADEKYRRTYGDAWKEMLVRRLEFVNDTFRRQFSTEFYAQDFREWKSHADYSMSGLIDELHKNTWSIQDAVVIGIIQDKHLPLNWCENTPLGCSLYLGNVLILKDLPTRPEVRAWDSLDESMVLTHELGHTFGASHILDERSIMNPQMSARACDFDEVNAGIIRNVLDSFFTHDYLARIKVNLPTLATMYRFSGNQKIDYVETLGLLLHYVCNNYAFDIDEAQVLIQDDALFNAAQGYSHFFDNDLTQARNAFMQAVALDPDFAVAYHYLGLVYDGLENEGEALRNHELAREKGYTEQSD